MAKQEHVKEMKETKELAALAAMSINQLQERVIHLEAHVEKLTMAYIKIMQNNKPENFTSETQEAIKKATLLGKSVSKNSPYGV